MTSNKMGMDTPLVTALISAASLALGSALTWMTARRSSGDARISLILTGHKELLDSYRADNEKLSARVDQLETADAEKSHELLQMREALSEQGMEVLILRQRESDLRDWARDIMVWCALAIGVIRGASLQIEEPPRIPRTYSSGV